MLPKVIIHNSVSLDGSLTNFVPNMELHYQIAWNYKPNAHLIGSNTVKVGVELYGEGVPLEEKSDFEKPERDRNFPLWVIPDTTGALKGLLHTCRRFEYCRDVIVLISKETPEDYLVYLRERNYDYHAVGKRHVDLKRSLELLSAKYKVKTVLADTGRILGNLLLEQGLVSELSLLIHPVIVGKDAYKIFGNINKAVSLKLRKQEVLGEGYVWLVYRVAK
ncbi:MAG: 5-amino-6-(5-phosphoribosylamino)uracil reductase [Crenarchaeota archaeon]|nr:5-amino-6-(5-phosphoribosylamino)uracil reductase [Thermoproteota archaeon]